MAMRTVASSLSLKKELLFHEAKPSEIVAVEGAINLLLSEQFVNTYLM